MNEQNNNPNRQAWKELQQAFAGAAEEAGFTKEQDVVDYIKAMRQETAVEAMKKFQREMAGEWEKAGLHSDEDVMDLIREMRAEEKG